MVLKNENLRKEIRNTGKFWKVVLEKMEKINWTNHVKNKEALHRVKEERNILHTL